MSHYQILGNLSFVLYLFFASSFSVNAVDHKVSVAVGYPTTDQNIDMQRYEVSYFFDDNPVKHIAPLYWYPVVNAGELQTSEGDSSLLGGGLGLSYYFSDEFKFSSEGGMYWLSQYEFGEEGVAYKDYGGPYQFYYKLGPSYAFDRNTIVGVAYHHISNGDRYAPNPALNTYQMYFVYNF